MAKVKTIDVGYQRYAEYQHYLESGFAQTAPKPLPLGRIAKWLATALVVGGAWPALRFLLSLSMN